MATATYDLLDSVTLTSSASSISFSGLTSLSSSYRDLIIVCELETDGALNALFTRFNGDSSQSYYGIEMAYATGGAKSGYSGQRDAIRSIVAQLDNVSNNFATYQIFDFNKTDKFKSVLVRRNKRNQGVEFGAYTWVSASAISYVTIYPDSNQFVSGSTAYLYGVAG